MKDIKLGFINYTNTVPIYYGLLTGKITFEGKLIKDVPGKLNKLLKSGELHISPVSSIEYARNQKYYYLLNNFCINSKGYVRSVILVSKVPIEELNRKKIGLTPASETSKILLKILLTDYFHFTPLYIELKNTYLTEEKPDAALLIGDDALNFKNPDYPYCFDLGELWREKTSLPVVFALWAIRRDFADKWPEKVHYVEKLLEKSYKLGLSDPEGIVNLSTSMCAKPVCTLEEYYKHLGYRFTEEYQKALLIFYKKASRLGFCKECKKLDFFLLPDLKQ